MEFLTLKFTKEAEERVIDFVKINEIWYTARSANYRDNIIKNLLWVQLDDDLRCEGFYINLNKHTILFIIIFFNS